MTLKQKTQVFAIIRFDSFTDSSVSIENRITVTKVVVDRATADAEVQRLNRVNASKSCTYFCQATRFIERTQ